MATHPKPRLPAVQGAYSPWLPSEVSQIADPQRDLPRIAREPGLAVKLQQAAARVPTRHRLVHGDARELGVTPASVHLVLTSPPYWTLKEYRPHPGQLGHVADYTEFLDELDRVWRRCFDALAPGGRLVCVVGDVCLARRRNEGRHTVVPLHAAIQERCRGIGFDNLAPIIWHKISNAQFEVSRGAGILGKPYEPNAVIKNDVEYVLMQRKPGGYRTPDLSARLLSLIGSRDHSMWFRQVWNGLGGASTRSHPAPFPLELALRLVRMFSFVGDTVLDPFMGTGTTSVAAGMCGRNSLGFEVDGHYFRQARRRVERDLANLFDSAEISAEGPE